MPRRVCSDGMDQETLWHCNGFMVELLHISYHVSVYDCGAFGIAADYEGPDRYEWIADGHR